MTDAEELELLELEKEKSLAEKPTAKDEQPVARGLLPESVGKYLFPTENESAAMRAKQGIPIVPPEPVPEYSPEEEMALGSVLGPQAIRSAAPVVLRGAQAAGGLIKGAGRQVLKSRIGRLGTATALGNAVWDGGKRVVRGLMAD